MSSARDGFIHVAYSEHPVAAIGAGEIAAELLDANHARPDVLFVFVTKPFAGALEDIAPALKQLISPTTLIGCAAEQVISPDGWLVDGPCIQVMAINCGEVETVRYTPGDLIVPPADQTIVMLAEPNTTEISLLTDLCGGYASQLVLDGHIYNDGAIGVLFPPQTPLHRVTDTYGLDRKDWVNSQAVLAFSEVDLQAWNENIDEIDDEQTAPVLCGFLSRRSFPKTLIVFEH